jgi:hypothetical protein
MKIIIEIEDTLLDSYKRAYEEIFIEEFKKDYSNNILFYNLPNLSEEDSILNIEDLYEKVEDFDYLCNENIICLNSIDYRATARIAKKIKDDEKLNFNEKVWVLLNISNQNLDTITFFLKNE